MKKKIAIIMSITLIISSIFSGCGKSKESNSIDDIKLKDNQKIITAQISEIYGNEISFTVVEEATTSNETTSENSDKTNTTEESTDEKVNNETASSNNSQEETTVENVEENDKQGEIPDGANQMGEMPSGMEEKFGNRNGGENASGSNQREQTTAVMYTKTDKTGETRIPVGTTVTTMLGTETTFSRLAANDIIKMIVETDDDGIDTVVGVWIVA